jgi:hypothetical protein
MKKTCCNRFKIALDKDIILYEKRMDIYRLEKKSVGYIDIMPISFCPFCGKGLWEKDKEE